MAAQLEGLEFDQFVQRYEFDPDVRINSHSNILKSSYEAFGLEDAGLLEDAASSLADQARDKLLSRGHDGVVYVNEMEGGRVVVPIRDPASQIRFAIPNAQIAQALCEIAEVADAPAH